MSLRHIEELTSALVEARSGNLSNTQFQIVVLEGLISLKESHVSLRSRLFNLQEDIDNQTQSEDQTANSTVVAEQTTGLQLIEEDLPDEHLMERSQEVQTITSQAIGSDFTITKSMMKKAKQHFDYDAVKVFETLFSHQLPEDETSLAFNKAVALLNRLGFKHYGDGKYPLPHYLREIVGNKKIVSFPNFLQAISFSMNSPIPLGLKNGFEKMDEDTDGELDAEEVYKMLQMVSKSNYSREDCMQFLLAADKDESGALSYVELLKFFYFTD